MLIFSLWKRRTIKTMKNSADHGEKNGADKALQDRTAAKRKDVVEAASHRRRRLQKPSGGILSGDFSRKTNGFSEKNVPKIRRGPTCSTPLSALTKTALQKILCLFFYRFSPLQIDSCCAKDLKDHCDRPCSF